MKITKQRLKEIIKEELSRTLMERDEELGDWAQRVGVYLVGALESEIHFGGAHPDLHWEGEDRKVAAKLIATRLTNGDKLPASPARIASDIAEHGEFPMAEGDGPEEFVRGVFGDDEY